jgi:hypothetical protein
MGDGVAVAVATIVAILLVTQRDSGASSAAPSSASTPMASPPASGTRVASSAQAAREDSHILGDPADGSVTVVEFLDFECESCAAWGVLLAVARAVGFLAAAQLTIDKFRILTNPGYLPACTLFDQVNRGTVMQSWQSTTRGFPNSLIGIAGFTVVVTFGVAVLAGARPAPWFWWGLVVGDRGWRVIWRAASRSTGKGPPHRAAR